jgi:hypothetical protein
MIPVLKGPGTKRLKLKCDEPFSDFAFNLNLRCHNKGRPKVHLRARLDSAEASERAMDSGSGKTAGAASSIEDEILTKGLQRAVSVGSI